jgi:hypothetical protein
LAITLASVISPYNRLQIAIGEERGMARLIMGNLMTFDGFVEGPNRAIRLQNNSVRNVGRPRRNSSCRQARQIREIPCH